MTLTSILRLPLLMLMLVGVVLLWATKRMFLDTVTLTMRTLATKDGTKFTVSDLLQLKLKQAFICDMEVVGNYAAQPCLDGYAGFFWSAAAPLSVGPVEQLRISYRDIEWHVNGTKVFNYVKGKSGGDK